MASLSSFIICNVVVDLIPEYIYWQIIRSCQTLPPNSHGLLLAHRIQCCFFLTWPISVFSSIIFCVHLFVPRILAKLDYLLVPKYKVSFFLPGYASSCLWPCPINILFSHGTFKALIRGFLVYQASLLSCDSQILVWIRITWGAGRRQMTQSHPQNFQFNGSGG